MLEIKGRVNTAICYAKVIEDEAIDQIRRMCDYLLTLLTSNPVGRAKMQRFIERCWK